MCRQVLVTGAGSGIGRAVAVKLAAAETRVLLMGRNRLRLEDTAKRCVQAGGSAVVCPADVAVRHEVEEALHHENRIDGMVAAAGICQRTYLDDETADQVFERVMRVNVSGVWNLFRVLHGRWNNGGSAVVVSSGLGKLGRAGYTAYSASKHAALGLVKSLALELASVVRVNAVCPGWVDTEMARADLQHSANREKSSMTDIRQRAEADIPLGRFVTALEVANLACWLLSDESGVITGQSINISGGEFTC